MAMNIELGELPYELEILDLSPVSLRSHKLTCVASIGVRPIRDETIPHFLWRDPAQKTNLK